MTNHLESLASMRYGAEFLGRRYDYGVYDVTVAGQQRQLTMRLRPGYSGEDHLYDLVLAAVAQRLAAKPDWSSSAALLEGIFRAQVHCDCNAASVVALDGTIIFPASLRGRSI